MFLRISKCMPVLLLIKGLKKFCSLKCVYILLDKLPANSIPLPGRNDNARSDNVWDNDLIKPFITNKASGSLSKNFSKISSADNFSWVSVSYIFEIPEPEIMSSSLDASKVTFLKFF